MLTRYSYPCLNKKEKELKERKAILKKLASKDRPLSKLEKVFATSEQLTVEKVKEMRKHWTKKPRNVYRPLLDELNY